MKPILSKLPLIYFPILLLMAACSSDQGNTQLPSSAEQGATAGPLPEPANALPDPAAPAPSETAPAPKPSTPSGSSYQSFNPPANPPASAQPTASFPKGKPVAGKKGYVLSPYAEHAGLVEVIGFPPGTVVKCPFTGKNFIVP
jgi:hypothetical protein